MRVVDFDHEIADRELQLVRPQLAGLIARRERQPGAEIEQDVRGLRDHQLAGLEEGRRERRMPARLPSMSRHHRGHAALRCARRRRSRRRLLQASRTNSPRPWIVGQ